ncbi:hypothetical protein X801_03149 [Opisthorchis viverrini]|uniref:Uncharacterized protein n=1 Tax=Opisthorchis viverrini TaxID=6198 RepID=A0A1S8X2M8_OPIVI|nr:hypothetical protein X801_03149 [Opisthorchis viverrini]
MLKADVRIRLREFICLREVDRHCQRRLSRNVVNSIKEDTHREDRVAHAKKQRQHLSSLYSLVSVWFFEELFE